jgi:uncharacterized membrane protein YccF (DUF307 family)
MVFAGNLLWFVFGGGIIAWFLWILLGLLKCITVVGIPFGFAHFKLARVCFAPLGKKPFSKEFGMQARLRAASVDLDTRLSK